MFAVCCCGSSLLSPGVCTFFCVDCLCCPVRFQEQHCSLFLVSFGFLSLPAKLMRQSPDNIGRSSVTLFCVRLFTALLFGVRVFIIQFIYTKFPRIKQRHDGTRHMWRSLPTDADIQEHYHKAALDRVRVCSDRDFPAHFLASVWRHKTPAPLVCGCSVCCRAPGTRQTSAAQVAPPAPAPCRRETPSSQSSSSSRPPNDRCQVTKHFAVVGLHSESTVRKLHLRKMAVWRQDRTGANVGTMGQMGFLDHRSMSSRLSKEQ